MAPPGVRATVSPSCVRTYPTGGDPVPGRTGRTMDPRFANALRSIVGDAHALTEPGNLRSYMYDGGVDQAAPAGTVLPGSTEEVAAVVRLCRDRGVSFVP